VLFKKVR